MILGGIKNKIDLRDRGLKLGSAIDIPDTYIPDWSKYQKYYQGQQPACGAHAGSYIKTIQESIESGVKPNFSPRFLWNEIKKIDNYPIEVGTDMRSILKVLSNRGICDASLLPNDVELSFKEYANANITQEMLDNAHPRIIDSYGFVRNWSFESLKSYIYTFKAVLLLLYVDDAWFRSISPTFTNRLYGHFVVAAGFDEGGIYVLDSTERDFTRSVKYIRKKYLPFIREVGTATDANNTIVSKHLEIIKLLQKVVQIYYKLLNK